MQNGDLPDHVLVALRRIIRATDLHSRKLGKKTGLTTPQLVSAAMSAASAASSAQLDERTPLPHGVLRATRRGSWLRLGGQPVPTQRRNAARGRTIHRDDLRAVPSRGFLPNRAGQRIAVQRIPLRDRKAFGRGRPGEEIRAAREACMRWYPAVVTWQRRDGSVQLAWLRREAGDRDTTGWPDTEPRVLLDKEFVRADTSGVPPFWGATSLPAVI